MLAPHDPRLLALLHSYTHFTGATLCTPEELFDAPFVVLAHGVEVPPILFYGNQRALDLCEMSFDAFTRMPSLRTAEPDRREAREVLLADVARRGYSTGYRGVRISSTGKRFEIEQAMVWNIIAEDGECVGQAAMFKTFRAL